MEVYVEPKPAKKLNKPVIPAGDSDQGSNEVENTIE